MTRTEKRRLRQLSTIFWAALTVTVFLALLACGEPPEREDKPRVTPSPIYLRDRASPQAGSLARNDALTTPVKSEPVSTPEEQGTREGAGAAPDAPARTEWVRYPVPIEDELQRYIEGVCKEYCIEASVVFAVIDVESGCDAGLIGDGGRAFGLMQVRPDCHLERCQRLGAVNLLDPRQNVRAGVDFLAELRDCGHGMDWALSWYNGHMGEPCEYAWRVLTLAEQLQESAQVMAA